MDEPKKSARINSIYVSRDHQSVSLSFSNSISPFHDDEQASELTAKVLMTAGHTCECRGPIYVKGKGTLITFFVKTPFDDKI